MPGETKIFKNTSGWYNVEKPGVYHATRDAARAARKATIVGTTATATAPTSTPTPIKHPQTGMTMTGLQQRLFDRLTQRQGVDTLDALFVVTSNGYNAAASYGHMREAGATHAEALAVIWLDSPTVSVSYGRLRAAGNDHTSAYKEALRAAASDD